MGINFELKEPSIIKLYNKAVSGDHDAIMEICNFYDQKDKPHKTLEWLIFGAQKGLKDFMPLIGLHAISMMTSGGKPDNDKLILGIYWAEN